MRPQGEIISIGCNEVPKPGGGTYWEDDTHDFRDFRAGFDSSAKMKREVLQDVFRRLRDRGWLTRKREQMDIATLVENAMFQGSDPVMKGAPFLDILEFGRIIHAEMSAITDAARLGLSLKGATLHTTTFPCHICARHIVSSGIERVVYIEPYSKSLAAELYPDSIEIEGIKKLSGPKVRFEPFVGIAPERYVEIFSKGKRKTRDGTAESWNPMGAEPILRRLVPAYLKIEAGVLKSLFQLTEKVGLRPKWDPKST